VISQLNLGMRAVVQRVKKCSVTAGGKIVGQIGPGLLVLLGIARDDSRTDVQYLSKKIANLRIFEDFEGRLNRSLMEIGGKMLVVSQFTLLGDCRKGRRPTFVNAAGPETATELYEYFVEQVRQLGISVETGRFRAKMEVNLINDGPVTLILESR
jgi:D-aminoacyl-tRNA deacylase